MPIRPRAAAVLAAALLVACAHPGAPTLPTPAGSASSAPAPAPSSTPRAFLRPTVYRWERQGEDAELDAELRAIGDPADFSAYLAAGYTWRDTYDLADFFAPSTFRARRWGSCTAHARMWVRWATLHRLEAWFVAFWAPGRAHAVAVFQWPRLTGPWRVGSNDAAILEAHAKPGQSYRAAAAAAAAADWSGGSWERLEVSREPDGAVVEELTRSAIPLP